MMPWRRRSQWSVLVLVIALATACGTGATARGGTVPLSASAVGSELAPMDVLVQYDYERTGPWGPDMYPWGRVPPFTLFADGTLIYVEGVWSGVAPTQVLSVNLATEDAHAIAQRVRDLGFERLEDRTGPCEDLGAGGQNCAPYDAPYTILRVRLASGTLRTVKIYSNLGPDPAALEAIRTYLDAYHHRAAQPYVPQAATLFVWPSLTQSQAPAWPLAATWLTPPGARTDGWVHALTDPDLVTLRQAMPPDLSSSSFMQGNQVWLVYMVPWLPGVTYDVGLFDAYNAGDQLSVDATATTTDTTIPVRP